MAIMRSQRGRAQAIKFLMNHLPKMQEEEEDILSEIQNKTKKILKKFNIIK